MSLVCCQSCKIVPIVLAAGHAIVYIATDLTKARHHMTQNFVIVEAQAVRRATVAATVPNVGAEKIADSAATSYGRADTT